MTARTPTYLKTVTFVGGVGTIIPVSLQDFVDSAIPPESTLTPVGGGLVWNCDTDPVAKTTLTGATAITIASFSAGRHYRLAVGGAFYSLAISGEGTTASFAAPATVDLINVDVVGTTAYATVDQGVPAFTTPSGASTYYYLGF